MSRPYRLRIVIAVLAAVLAAFSPPATMASAPVLVAHLPSSSIEATSRLAEAVGALAEHLDALAPGLVTVEPEIFRRLKDAQDYLAAEPSRVALALVDPAFLLDPPATLTLVPLKRLRVAGRGTYRRLVVVANSAEARVLADLRGRSLSVAEIPALATYLERAIFAGEVAPERWFAELTPTADDFAAVAAVLYDQTEAALVAEYNPLLESQRGLLRTVYRSPPLSLPVLAYNPARIDAAARLRLERALADLSATSAGRRTLELLAIDGFEPIDEDLAQTLLQLPATPPKTLTIVWPDVLPKPILDPLPPPTDLRWPLSLSLPPASEVP